MYSKIFTVLITILMIFSIVGCNSNNSNLEVYYDENEEIVNEVLSSIYSRTGGLEINGESNIDENPNREVKSFPVLKSKQVKNSEGQELSEEFYANRELLSSDGQIAYDNIVAGLYNAKNLLQGNNIVIDMRSIIKTDEIEQVALAVNFDHPQIFWLDWGYTWYYNSNGEVTSIFFPANDLVYDIPKYKEQVLNAMKPIIQKASQLDSDVEKVKFINDYLAYSITYVAGSPYNQTAYSAIVNKKAVCAGYAKSFKYYMDELGIPSTFVYGFAGENPSNDVGEHHAWNLVKLDGQYYNIDVTWNDIDNSSSNYVRYDYFNKSDNVFVKDHIRKLISQNLVSCNSDDMSIENVFANKTPTYDFNNLHSNIIQNNEEFIDDNDNEFDYNEEEFGFDYNEEEFDFDYDDEEFGFDYDDEEFDFDYDEEEVFSNINEYYDTLVDAMIDDDVFLLEYYVIVDNENLKNKIISDIESGEWEYKLILELNNYRYVEHYYFEYNVYTYKLADGRYYIEGIISID